ncbi:aminopeptidase P N-terminal domain-containing protein [Persicobacter sp. CCB-QB2]|uniref:aminopeptidase P N-terminal domain-containing protein n=1 Tax=Persicobacter sp. CCB-QB2 TaxID=1561025 RepID=UPI0006A98718|nr:aminopeptidase P N-terminal domain-containing protein [Persicobacter sp. CCB-QB2]
MKYETIDPSLFVANRKRLAKMMKPNSLAVFNAADIMPTSADGTMKFKQQSDLFYLSGIDQEQTILVVYPDAINEEWREVLFLRETNEHIAIWEGHKYTKEEATKASGIQQVKWLDDFETIFQMMMAEVDHVYLNTNEHWRAEVLVQTRDARFIKDCKERYPLHQYERAQPLLHHLRAVKSQQEIDLIAHACEITNKGFRRLLGFVKPGVMEYEVEAELIHEFVKNRSAGFAYEPIIASGFNACVLHYLENNRECKDGDLLLMDIGAEYGNYASDMTRTIPVNGRFSDRQRAVYDAVLRVFKGANEILQPGTNIPAYHKEVGKMMESELLALGLIDRTDIKNQDPAWPAYKKYFMHGTSHHLGLDVHDYGKVNREIAENMVFTIEPGIYIPEENMGVRLENDFVVKAGGNLDLMRQIPIEAEEIESLMNA